MFHVKHSKTVDYNMLSTTFQQELTALSTINAKLSQNIKQIIPLMGLIISTKKKPSPT
jgi:hypothetical protein